MLAANHDPWFDSNTDPDWEPVRTQLEKELQKRAKRAARDAKRPKVKEVVEYIGVDGEGIGRRPEPKGHRYILLAGGSESGNKQWYIEAPLEGLLTTEECLQFLIDLGSVSSRKLFTYSFNYDLTKLLSDVPDHILYLLFRPELRARPSTSKLSHQGPWPVFWNGWSLNLQGTKFSVSRGKKHHKRTVVIWDIWKFYQSKFVGALEDWKVGNEEDKALITEMKNRRSLFKDEERNEIRTYCFSECKFMAILAHKLVQAHNDAGLKLTSFYGAGSSASAMLKKMKIQDKLIKHCPEMNIAVASAFFGGRFENGVIGSIRGEVFNFDISSAYPYQLCFLPCLMHGTWRFTKNREALDNPNVKAACVEYCLHDIGNPSWGPFPFRDPDGSICFPAQCGGGWVWLDEYLKGERYFDGVQFESAWVYECKCDCQPFADIPHYYRERCRIGKEGAGIVFKLGPNSCYGKLAQSVGSAPFNSWIYAGMITSGCRAQVLEVIGAHKDRSNIILIATDGVLTREDVPTPIPRNTNTWEATVLEKNAEGVKVPVKKPLGGWERSVMSKGVFAARPGIYFPLNPTLEDLKKVRGRGVGKGTVLENWQKIADAWENRGENDNPVVQVKNLERFCGAKTCISYAPSQGSFTRAEGGRNVEGGMLPDYGQWIKRKVQMSFHPMPKRAGIAADGISLTLRRIPYSQTSMPYDKAIKSPEKVELENATQEILEQPDGDFVDFDNDDEGDSE